MADLTHVRVLKAADETKAYVDEVRRIADQNKTTLGFTPKLAYEHAAARGRLWLAISQDDDYCGHLYFGGKHPTLRIWQLFVRSKFRSQGIGRLLIEDLVRYSEQRHYDVVVARVAADLAANQAWEKLGFRLLRQVPGGKTTQRIINVRIRDLSSPDLFGYLTERVSTSDSKERPLFACRPVFESPNFLLDVNVILDVLKGRADADVAREVLSIGLSGIARVMVAEEFVHELARHTSRYSDDPALELAKLLPKISNAPEDSKVDTRTELVEVVFPSKESLAVLRQNDRSDIEHVAAAIHHGLAGVITSDEALLSAGENVATSFGVDILSPEEFCNRFLASEVAAAEKLVALPAEHLVSIRAFEEADRTSIEAFLSSIGVNRQQVVNTLAPGSQYEERIRLVVFEDNIPIGAAAWTRLTDALNSTRLYLFIDETHPSALRAIDHVFERVLRDSPLQKLVSLELIYNPDQDLLHQTAKESGFRYTTDPVSGSPSGLSKMVYRGVLTNQNWAIFRQSFKEITGASCDARMPTFQEAKNTGVLIHQESLQERVRVPIFEFETLFSPVLTLCEGRDGIIVPIQASFASDLLASYATQLSFLPELEASLYMEKAYFRHPNRASIFSLGMPVFFYVSGHAGGAQEVVGHGRITFSDVISVDEADARLSRQGVLPHQELLGVSRDGRVHAFTFDNFNLFPEPVTYAELRSSGIVKSSLQSAERIAWKEMLELCKTGYRSGQ